MIFQLFQTVFGSYFKTCGCFSGWCVTVKHYSANQKPWQGARLPCTPWLYIKIPPGVKICHQLSEQTPTKVRTPRPRNAGMLLEVLVSWSIVTFGSSGSIRFQWWNSTSIEIKTSSYAIICISYHLNIARMSLKKQDQLDLFELLWLLLLLLLLLWLGGS